MTVLVIVFLFYSSTIFFNNLPLGHISNILGTKGYLINVSHHFDTCEETSKDTHILLNFEKVN